MIRATAIAFLTAFAFSAVHAEEPISSRVLVTPLFETGETIIGQTIAYPAERRRSPPPSSPSRPAAKPAGMSTQYRCSATCSMAN